MSICIYNPILLIFITFETMNKGIIRLLLVLYPFIALIGWYNAERSYDMDLQNRQNISYSYSENYREQGEYLWRTATEEAENKRTERIIVSFVAYPIIVLAVWFVASGFKEKK